MLDCSMLTFFFTRVYIYLYSSGTPDVLVILNAAPRIWCSKTGNAAYIPIILILIARLRSMKSCHRSMRVWSFCWQWIEFWWKLYSEQEATFQFWYLKLTFCSLGRFGFCQILFSSCCVTVSLWTLEFLICDGIFYISSHIN